MIKLVVPLTVVEVGTDESKQGAVLKPEEVDEAPVIPVGMCVRLGAVATGCWASLPSRSTWRSFTGLSRRGTWTIRCVV